jgi:DNA-binding CsgD family transcriptional regulator
MNFSRSNSSPLDNPADIPVSCGRCRRPSRFGAPTKLPTNLRIHGDVIIAVSAEESHPQDAAQYLCEMCWWKLVERRFGFSHRLLINVGLPGRPRPVVPDLAAAILRADVQGFNVAAKAAFSRRFKPRTPRERVRETKDSWTKAGESRAAIAEVFAGAPSQARAHIEAAFYLISAISRRRLWCRYLRSRFRYDVNGHRFLRGARTALSFHEAGLFLHASRQYAANSSIILAALRAQVMLCTSEGDGREDVESQISHITNALREAYWEHPMQFIAASMLQTNFKHRGDPVAEAVREDATMSLAGLVRANLKISHGLSGGVDAIGGKDALLDCLPGLVLLSSAEIEGKERPIPTLRRLVCEVGRRILAEQLQDHRKLRKPMPEELTDSRALDFQRNIESRAEAAAWIEGAELSLRQKEILDGQMEGRKDAEIAQTLGISQGAVKAHWSRARKKLESEVAARLEHRGTSKGGRPNA